MSQQKLDVTNDEAVFHAVFVPTFLEKCAALGHPARTMEDAQTMIDMAARLDVLDTQENNNLLKSASAALEEMVPGVQSIAAGAANDDVTARAQKFLA